MARKFTTVIITGDTIGNSMTADSITGNLITGNLITGNLITGYSITDRSQHRVVVQFENHTCQNHQLLFS
ncbi:MAG: hypothetical protein WBP64_12545 [Nitrososphaeraceae archaeon]